MGMQVVQSGPIHHGLPITGVGAHTLAREMVGTRYAIVVVRFFVDFFE